ncbi:hypothetical protein ACUODF_13855, partial [Escherichia coli]
DYPVIQCFTLMMVVVFVVCNLIVDLLRNFNGVPGLNRDNFIYISNIFSNIKQRNEKIMQ